MFFQFFMILDFNENLQDIWDLNKEKSPDKSVRNINAKNRGGFIEIIEICTY